MRDSLTLENISPTDSVLAQVFWMRMPPDWIFAEALHAAQCLDGERFVTFDNLLVRGARKAGLCGVTLLKA